MDGEQTSTVARAIQGDRQGLMAYLKLAEDWQQWDWELDWLEYRLRTRARLLQAVRNEAKFAAQD